MYTAQENLEDWNQFGSNSLVARKCLWYFAFCKWVVRAVSLSSPPQRKQSTTAPELSGALQGGVCQMCHLTLWRQNSYSWKNSSLPTADFSKTCFSQEVITTIKAGTALLSMKWTKILQIPLWLRLMVIDFISCKQQTWNLSIWEMQTEFAETSYCEVSETSLCIIFAINSFPIFSFSRKHFHRVEHSVCSQLRGTRKQQPSLTSWLAASMYVSGIQSDLLLELIWYLSYTRY